MTTIASLLADPKAEGWALSTCEFLQAVTDSSLEDAAFRAQVCHLLKAAYDDADFVHCYLSVGQYVEEMLEDTRPAPPPRPPTPRPAEPVFFSAPLAPVAAPFRLPSPLTAITRVGILGIYEKEPKPTSHGCGYFEGAPWDVCYACEYEKDPANYARKMRHGDLIQLIGASFRDVRKGNLADSWSNETMESVMNFLDTPRAERCYTDAQVADPSFQDGTTLLASLRELMR